MDSLNETFEEGPITNLAALVQFAGVPIDDFELLPLCHTTNLNAVKKMIEQQYRIKAWEEDPTFNEFLTFFFYGRARYIPKEDIEVIYKKDNPPIILLFNFEDISNPHRIVAFDSGGYPRYKIDLPINDFAIPIFNNGDEIKIFLKKVYSENANYLNLKVTLEPYEYPLCRALASLAKIYNRINSPDENTTYGQQACTIEVQYKVDLPLKPSHAVLPATVLSHPEGRKRMLKYLDFKEKDVKEGDRENDEDKEKKVFTYSLNKEIVYIYSDINTQVDGIIKKQLKPEDK